MTEQPKEQQNKPISAADLFSAMQSKGKLTGADVINSLLSEKGNLHMKTKLSNPAAFANVLINADWLEQNGYKEVADIDRGIALYYEQLGVSVNGERAKEVLQAAISVMQQEFELEKSKAKALMGR